MNAPISDDGFELYALIEDLPLDSIDASADLGDLPPEERPTVTVAPHRMFSGSAMQRRENRRHRLVVPLRRTLKKGMSGPDVVAVFRALSKWEHRHGVGSYHENPTPLYGAGKADRVRRFQKAHALKGDRQYGPRTHERLLPFFDAYGAHKMQAFHPKTGPGKKRQVATDVAMFAYRNCGHHYSQNSYLRCQAYYQKAKPPHTYTTEDCSGFDLFTKWCASIYAGPVDGWTGTMRQHGRVVSRATCEIADSAHYTNHVAPIVSVRNRQNILVMSWGHEGAPFFVPMDYRDDLIEIRSYTT